MNSFTANGTKLGFIGRGSMGSRVLARLRAAGYEVSVFRRNQAKRAALEAKGATACESVRELARSVHVVLSCLTDDQAVGDVYFGRDGVLANVEPGTIVIEMSAILPATSRELASKASQAGVEALDVAISGSTPAAEQGTLTLLAGGSRAARGEYGPQFPLPLMNKDFRLILGLAGEVDAAMPATSAAFQVSTAALNRYADLDFSAVMEYMEQASAKEASSISTTG
jgi:3-hydroxyisobutyrate dehydrogenase-like beta-hydroxyacid dehydrogenase